MHAASWLHLGRLEALEQEVLEVGSVAGAEFAVASIAAGGQLAPEVVEAVCERLAQRGQFLEERGLVAWPDGTVSGCYGFRHALHQEVLYRRRLGSGRRARWHLRIGESEEARYGARVGEQAADNALQRYAYQEALRRHGCRRRPRGTGRNSRAR